MKEDQLWKDSVTIQDRAVELYGAAWARVDVHPTLSGRWCAAVTCFGAGAPATPVAYGEGRTIQDAVARLGVRLEADLRGPDVKSDTADTIPAPPPAPRSYESTCSSCRGTGAIAALGSRCPACGGRGWVRESAA